MFSNEERGYIVEGLLLCIRQRTRLRAKTVSPILEDALFKEVNALHDLLARVKLMKGE